MPQVIDADARALERHAAASAASSSTHDTDLAADLPAIAGVESEIREALTNLVFNAVDAMPEGGTLTLRTRRTETRPIGHGGVGAASRAASRCRDTGIGMDDETRRRCLEPFFTTKGERGTGLGLADGLRRGAAPQRGDRHRERARARAPPCG